LEQECAQHRLQRTAASPLAGMRREPAKVLVGEGVLPAPPLPLKPTVSPQGDKRMPKRIIYIDEYGNKVGERTEPTDAEKAIGTILFFGLIFMLVEAIIETIALFIQYCIEHPRFSAIFFGIAIPIGLYVAREHPGALLFIYPAWAILLIGISLCLFGNLWHRFLFPLTTTMALSALVLNFYYLFSQAKWPVIDSLFSKPFWIFTITGAIIGLLGWFTPRISSFILGGMASSYFALAFGLGEGVQIPGTGPHSLFGNPYLYFYPIFMLIFIVGGLIFALLYRKFIKGVSALIGTTLLGLSLVKFLPHLSPQPWWLVIFIMSLLFQTGIGYHFKTRIVKRAKSG